MSDNPTKETVSQVLDLLLGDANGPKGHLTNAVREQIMPQIEATGKRHGGVDTDPPRSSRQRASQQ